MKSFNINYAVKVRLTDFGKQMLEKDWNEFWNSCGMLDKFPYEPKQPDENGYVRFQLWDLMYKLGKYCDWCYRVAGQPEPEYNMSFEMEDEE